ncbi:MAG: tetratricopeptide repeat protein [Patescibacteria group bacterium]
MININTVISGEKSGRLDKASFIVILITLFFTPIFFVPAISVPFQIGKSSFILYGIILSFILWCIARLRDGIYVVPKTLIYVGSGILALAYTLAALFSENQATSLSGQGFELGTLSFFLPSLFLFSLVPLVVKSQKEISHSYMALTAAFLVVGIFHVIRFIFGPETLSFGILTSVTANFFGKWNDVAIFFGLGAIFSCITLDRGSITKWMKVLIHILLVLSLVMLIIVNFSTVWTVLAVISFIYLIYELSFGKTSLYLGARLSYHTLIVLTLSVIFIFAGGKIGGIISNSLGISQVEVRPSWSATLDVSKAALKENTLFGVGPNRFSSEWLLHKPAGINNTPFWNVDFNYGIGFIPSFLLTTGIIGFLAVLFFVGLFLVKSIKALFHESSPTPSRYLLITSLFTSVYLWIFSIVYVPSSAIWILTLVLSALSIASMREEGLVRITSYSVIEKPAASFISVLFTILLLIASLAFGYFVTERLIANVYFQKSIMTVNQTGNLDQAVVGVANAISLGENDVYYQTLAEIYLAKINILLNDKNINQTEAQKQFQNNLASAIQAAQGAIKIDPTNYRNHLMLGRVFEAVVPLNISGTYENAKKSYESALTLNPDSPEIYLILARLETVHKDNKAAKDYITLALKKKNDYADAIFMLSQIQIAENDVPNAIRSVEAVATLSPSDPGIFFQLGLLYYNEKNYQNAVFAMEKAITLNPQYANAKYFLGLSYYQIGEEIKAMTQFKDLQVSNPDNAEIKTIITNLEAGRSPLSNQIAPEKRRGVPVKETSTREEI